MNPTIDLLASRRRKLDFEEVYDVYREPPVKAKKIVQRPDQQAVDSGMDVDAVPVSFHAHSFPVNSFPLDGVNGWMSSLGCPRMDTPQSVSDSPFSKSFGIDGVWSRKNLPMDSGAKGENASGHTSGYGRFCVAQKETEKSVQRVLTTHHQGVCPQCLSGKSGHFHHIQSRIRQLQNESRYPDGMTCQNINGYTDRISFSCTLPKTSPRTQRYFSRMTNQTPGDTPME